MQQSLHIPGPRPSDPLLNRERIHQKQRTFNLKHLSKHVKLHTTKSNDSSSYTAAVHRVLPVRYASVLQMKNKQVRGFTVGLLLYLSCCNFKCYFGSYVDLCLHHLVKFNKQFYSRGHYYAALMKI